MAIFWAVCAAFLASVLATAITRARVRADCRRLLEQCAQRTTKLERRWRYAEWLARNAAETNTDEVGRWALIEIALLVLCSENTTEVATQLRNQLATSRALIASGLEPNMVVAAVRNSWLDSMVGELELKRPNGEQWDAWVRIREECPHRPPHNLEALKWFRGALQAGRYQQSLARYQAAIGALCSLEHAQPGLTRQLLPRGEDPTGLLPEIEKMGQSNSRLLPCYGENPV